MNVWPMQFHHEGNLMFDAGDQADFKHKMDEFEFEQVWGDIRAKLLDEMNMEGLEGFRLYLLERLHNRPADVEVERFVMLGWTFRGRRFRDPAKPKNRLKKAEWEIWKEMEPRFDAPGADREALLVELQERSLAAV